MKKKLSKLIVAAIVIGLVNTGLTGYLVCDKINTIIQNRPVVISRDYDKGQSLDKAMATGKPMIVLFYTDWCRYCQKFVPATFKKLTKDKQMKEAYAMAYVNAEAPENEKYVKEYKIEGYPSVFLVKDGKKEMVPAMELFVDGAHKSLKKKFLELAE